MVEQYEVYWVELDPTQGGEMAKTRPCVVVSPTGLNNHLKTVVVAPVTSTIRNVSFRVRCFFGWEKWRDCSGSVKGNRQEPYKTKDWRT